MGEVKARTVLWYLVFFGFAVNYMIRINLNITIVEMIATKKKIPPPAIIIEKNISSHDGGYFALSATTTATIINQYISQNESKNITNPVLTNSYRRGYSLEQHFLHWIHIEYDPNGFHWNEYIQGLVLGSFYWAHWMMQIPGGILAKKYGTKLIFGLSNAVGCWICILIPIFSYLDYRILIILRVLQGLITGLAWPAMHVLTAKWIPPNERSKFVTSYLGSSVGTAAFYPFFGYVMHWISWEWVFHICAAIGTIWWIAWLFFVYDSPAEHPRIREKELLFIEKSLGSSVLQSNEGSIPWRAILTSRPVWMNVLVQFGGIWGLFTLLTQAPTYLRVIHNLDIRATGSFSGLPHIMRMFFGLMFSWFADYVLRTNKMKRTNLRKLATIFCSIFNGIIVLALAYFGNNAVAAIICLTSATMLHGAVSSGPLASIVDIAPNYAGIVLGISGMIGVLPGFISPWIIGILTLGNQTFEAWKNVFLITAGMLIGTGVPYVLFSDSSLQPWNNINAKDATIKELSLLNKIEITKSDDKVQQTNR